LQYFQLKFVATPSAVETVFIDNIYFYKAPAALIEMPIDFESTTLTYPWGGFGSATFGAIPVSVVVNQIKQEIIFQK
jgi:hypothetical protein